MLNNTLIVIFLCLFTPFSALSQYHFSKAYLSEKNNQLISVSGAGTVTRIQSDQRFNNIITDTAQIFRNPETGLYADLPVLWDMSDSLMFQIRLFNDGGGMTHSQIRVFEMDKLFNHQQDSFSLYIDQPETLKDNYSLPFELRATELYYQNRTDKFHKGHIAFDFCITRDSFLLFFYLEEDHELEIWSYTRFALWDKKLRKEDRTAILNDTIWKLVKTISLDIDGLFMPVCTGNITCLLLDNGIILRLNGNQSFTAGALVDQTGQVLIITDKENDRAY